MPRTNEPIEAKLFGTYAPMFWTMIFCNFVVPVALLTTKKSRSIGRVVTAGALVCVGMWMERYLIVVPTLERPRLLLPLQAYTPSFVEISMAISNLAALVLALTIATRIYPMVSLWEVQDDLEDASGTFPMPAPDTAGQGDSRA